MPSEKITTLLIEDNPADARLVRELLRVSRAARFEVEWSDRLGSGLHRLTRGGIDGVWLDLSLPDCRGPETITRVHGHAPHVPIVVLSGNGDEDVMLDAVRNGAQDYLEKDRLDPDSLARSMRYAIDRKRYEEELVRSRDAALEASRLKSNFLANMSHEIRTPLSGVIGMTEMLLDSGLDSEQAQCAETIRASADSLLTIVNDILEFSRIAADKIVLENREFDPARLAREVTTLLSVEARRKGLELTLSVAPGVRRRLRGDPVRLRQVLCNLIGNAVKFTDQGGVRVSLSPEAESEEALTLRFAVSDTGIGIAPSHHRRLFQPFSQIDSASSRKHGGTGLGLAISARLVGLMGGKIELESESGRGSTFQFRVCLGKSAGDRPSAPA